MKEKIWLVIQEGVRDKESYDVMIDQILSLIREKIEKELLTDEEIMAVRRQLGGMYEREYSLIKAGVQAQLDKVLKALEN